MHPSFPRIYFSKCSVDNLFQNVNIILINLIRTFGSSINYTVKKKSKFSLPKFWYIMISYGQIFEAGTQCKIFIKKYYKVI